MVENCSARATTVDHVVPLVAGGSMYDLGNLRAACPAHNYAAGAALSGGSAPVLGSPSRTWVVR